MIPLGVLASARHAVAGSGVLPTDYGNLSAWWKADAITGLADGAALSPWVDSSGSGYNATATGTQRPTYRTSQVGGLPALDFDGADDWLNSSAPSNGNEQTLFAVVRLDTIGLPMMIRGAAGGGALSMEITDTGNLALANAGSAPTVTSAALSTGVWYILAGSASASLDFMRVRVGGVQTAATWTGTAATVRGTRISNNTANNGGRLDGKIAELIVYQALRSDAEIVAIEGYLAAKYGL